MKLFRIDYEWYEYDFENTTHKRYSYVTGLRNLGKRCFQLLQNEDTIFDIVKLGFSLRGLWICLRKTDSQFKNLTKKKY